MSYDEEMGRSRPLDMAKRRDSGTAELADLSDLARRPRQSQPSASTGPRQNALANKDDPIIILSSSEDDRSPEIRPTQRRMSGPAGTQGNGANRKRAPPRVDPEVILILDSDEEAGARGVVGESSGVTRVTPPVHPYQEPPGAPPLAPAQLPEPPLSTRPRGTRQKDAELPTQTSPSPSYGPPPDDFDDPFNDIDFDTTGNDANAGGPLESWDGLDIGPSLATLPVVVSSCAANADASTSTSVPEGGEDVLGSDAFFDSYVNIDELEGDTDQATGEDALSGGGGDGVEEREVESGAANCLGGSTREGESSSIPGSGDNANVDGDGDVRMQSLEEGEVDPKDAPVRSTRHPDTPESGEIRSQELGSGSGAEVWTAEGESPSSGSVAPGRVLSSSEPVVAKLAPTSTVAHPTSSASTSLSPSCGSPRSTASQPLGRPRTFVMPDISSYKGVRFKRPLPEARENSFFSRALNGAGRSSGKAPGSVEERSASGGAPVEVPSSIGEMQSWDARDADMQDDAATSTAVVVPTSSPSPLAQQPTEAPPRALDTQNTSSTAQVRPPIVESSTTTTDGLPAFTSTQPTPLSGQAATPSRAPPATQPLARSSSRPFIAPPRTPRPSAPMSLVDALNEMRRQRLEALEEQRGLARRRSVVDLAGASVPVEHFILSDVRHPASEDVTASASASPPAPAPPTSADQGPGEAVLPPQSSTSTPPSSRSQSQSTRVLGRTPSLNDIRTLLARRNVSASQPCRPTTASTSTSTPTHTHTHAFDEDGDTHALAELFAVPSLEPMDGVDQLALPSEEASTKSTTVSALESGASSSSGGPSASARRRRVPFVPFEAFISPMQSRSKNVKNDRDHDGHQKGKSIDKGKGKEIVYADDVIASPTVARSRVSMGASASVSSLGSQRSKRRESRHVRRESASAAFEVYIVRDSPKQTSGARISTSADTDTGAGTGANDMRPRPNTKPLPQLQLPRAPRFSESGSVSASSPSSPSVASPVISDVVPVTVQVPVSDVGVDGPADDTRAMDVDAGNGCIDSRRVDDEVASGECGGGGVNVSVSVSVGEPEGRGEDEGEADEADEADTLLELASVHLSPTEAEVEAVAVHEVDKVVEMEVTDEVRCACMVCFLFGVADGRCF